MTGHIRHFLHISCFPNFRGDFRGMSGLESPIQGEGQRLYFVRMQGGGGAGSVRLVDTDCCVQSG